jgi:virginiamycin B lyase
MKRVLQRAAACALLIVVAGMAWPTPGGPPSDVEIREWAVPWAGRPRDPYVAADGRVWFVGQAGNYIAWFDPRTEEFERYEIADGTHPHNLIIDEAGVVWYAGNRNATIGRLDPATGAVRAIAMPEGVRDPHTLVFGTGGEIWFTAQGANYVGRLDPRTEEVRVVQVARTGSRPYGIVVDREGHAWLNLFGTHELARVDAATFELTTYAVPRETARTRRLATTRDGYVWYVDYADGYLGRFAPATGEFREWPAPSGAASRPYAMAVDRHDRIWFVETGVDPNRFVGFDPATGEFFANVPVPSGGGAVRHMYYHAPAHEIWFGTDTNNIGRARLP